MFIVKSCTDFIRTRRASKKPLWEFECWTYDLDGTEFNLIPVEFSFEDFKGSKSITSLHCYPLRYHKEDEEEKSEQSFQEKLIARGKRYYELCLKRPGSQIFEHDDYALSRGSGIRQVTKSASQDDESDARSARGGQLIPGRDSNDTPAKKQIVSIQLFCDWERLTRVSRSRKILSWSTLVLMYNMDRPMTTIPIWVI